VRDHLILRAFVRPARRGSPVLRYRQRLLPCIAESPRARDELARLFP